MNAEPEAVPDAVEGPVVEAAGLYRKPPPGIKASQYRDPVTGKIVSKKNSKKELRSDRASELEAMVWVQTHEGDETHQQAYYRRLWTEQPRYFDELYRGELARSGQLSGSGQLAAWDGVGECPVCKRAAESAGAPEGAELLIEDLLTAEVGDG